MRGSPMRLIQVRVTDREWHQIQDAAKASGRTLDPWVMQALVEAAEDALAIKRCEDDRAETGWGEARPVDDHEAKTPMTPTEED